MYVSAFVLHPVSYSQYSKYAVTPKMYFSFLRISGRRAQGSLDVACQLLLANSIDKSSVTQPAVSLLCDSLYRERPTPTPLLHFYFYFIFLNGLSYGPLLDHKSPRTNTLPSCKNKFTLETRVVAALHTVYIYFAHSL